ncbi:MAG: response regulator [Endomicrobiaceae bacterium]|nr:response regulator [Endomicrobiaceae bacterium]
MVKILIVDDEVFARDAMAKIVKRKGFEVFVAATGEECIAVFKKEDPHVVFLDIVLPDIDGDHIHTYLRELKQDVAIYYVTGTETIFTEEQASRAGAIGYLQKPVDITELFKVLDNIKEKFEEVVN